MKIASKVAHYIGCCFTSGYFHVLNAYGSYLSSVEIPVWESPVWSPDGKKIVFGSTSQVGTSDIYVMNADGTNPVLLTNQEVSNGIQSGLQTVRKLRSIQAAMGTQKYMSSTQTAVTWSD